MTSVRHRLLHRTQHKKIITYYYLSCLFVPGKTRPLPFIPGNTRFLQPKRAGSKLPAIPSKRVPRKPPCSEIRNLYSFEVTPEPFAFVEFIFLICVFVKPKKSLSLN